MKIRTAMWRVRSACLCVAAVALGSVDGLAQSIGSYVSGERPMFIEMDQLVGGQPFDFNIRNMPANVDAIFVVFSLGVEPTDVSHTGTPGFLGPDLTQNFGGVLQLGSDSVSSIADPAWNGARFYFQPWVRLTDGTGRLGSMLVTEQRATPVPDPPDAVLPIPLTTQEVLPPTRSGWDRSHGHVAVGVPLPQGLVEDQNGVAQLSLTSASQAQFTTLAQWPDGSVKWALVEYFSDVDAGESHTNHAVDIGSGNVGGSDLVTPLSDSTALVDTGRLSMFLDFNSDQIFDFMEVDGLKALQTEEPNTLVLIDENDHEWTYHGLGGEITINGPVRSEIRLDGVLTESSNINDNDRVYVRTYLSVVRDEPAVRAQVTLRNTSIQHNRNLLFRGFGWRGHLKVEGTLQVRAPNVATNGNVNSLATSNISGTQDALFYQGFVENTDFYLTAGHDDASYTPFLERISGHDFLVEGCRVRIASQDFAGAAGNSGFSAVTEFADPAFLDLWSGTSQIGMTAQIEHAPYTFPVAIHAQANGRLEVQLFPTKEASDSHHYPLTWMTSETRTFVLQPNSERPNDLLQSMPQYDYPLAARPALFAYNQSEIYPWRLVTPEQAELFLEDTGITEEDAINNETPIRTVYRFANATGSANNRWQASLSYYQWLRHGHGGSYLRAYWEALYKIDKMPVTLDDGDINDAPEVEDDTTATKKGKYYDGSKHTYFQLVPDMGYHRGIHYLLDSQSHFAATVMDEDWTSTKPFGNYVNGTYGAVTNSSIAMLQLGDNQELEDYVRLYMEQWAQIVYKQPNNFGVDTDTQGWQAPVGTPSGSPLNPDGYFVTRGTGKGVDFDNHGYTMQVWTDYRQAALAYQMCVHHFRSKNPNDPIIDLLSQRAQDFYSFARRSALDDHYYDTGEYFLTDIFANDPGDENADPFDAPGAYTGNVDATNYVLHPWVNFYLDQGPSETALSYGVELVNSISKPQLDKLIHDPTLNDFIARYLRDHGLANP